MENDAVNSFQTHRFRIDGGWHQYHSFRWIQKLVDDDHEKVHFFCTLMHLVQNDVRVMVQGLGVNQFLQQNTRCAVQYARVLTAMRLLIGAHLVSNNRTNFPATFIANALSIRLRRNSAKKSKPIPNSIELNKKNKKKMKIHTNRRGCATTMLQYLRLARASSKMYCGTCVVLPQPVEPCSTTTVLLQTLSSTLTRLSAIANRGHGRRYSKLYFS